MSWRARGLSPEALEQLVHGLPGSELQSLLLEVVRARARARSPAEVLAQYTRDRFTSPAAVDQRVALEVDRQLLAAAHAFAALELSPLTPLATCSSVALTDQNRVLSALRGTEVVSDPTNVLALECARRLRAAATPVHFTTSQRVVRAQPVPDLPGYAQHFRIFVLASGGLETQAHGFTVETMTLHIRTMLDALDRLEAAGYDFGARRLEVLAVPERAAPADRIAAACEARLPTSRGALTHGYYSGGLRYRLWVTPAIGEAEPLADGGSFDWLAQLLSNRRAVYVASGMGAQLVPLRFRRT
jgi:hypothetical protein